MWTPDEAWIGKQEDVVRGSLGPDGVPLEAN